jgi:hypothetical protein
MSGGGLNNIASNQPTGSNTGYNRPQFNAQNPTIPSRAQNWWTNTEQGQAAGGQEGLNKTLRTQIQDAMGNYGNMVNYANETGISQQDIQTAIGGNTDMYTYMNRPNYQKFGTNGQFNQPIYQSNYQNNNTGNAMGVSQYGMDPNVYMPRASNPFNPYTNSSQSPFSYYQQTPTAQPTATATGNTLTPDVARSLMQRSMVGGVPTSEFAKYGGYDAVQAMYDANNGSYAKPGTTQQATTQQPMGGVPYNYSQRATVPTYGTANQAIVGRSSSLRGTPNVMARKAEGGIASLMDDVE